MAFTEEQRTGNSSAPNRPNIWSKHWLLGLVVLGLLTLGAYAVLTRAGAAQSRAVPRGGNASVQDVPVVAVPARREDIPVYLTGLGAVTPLNTVTVKSRVDGQLMQVPYREGQLVNEGATLAEIDARPFQVQLAQAEGQMARDQALLADAKLDLQRFQALWSQDSIPKQQLDTQQALVRQYEGAVKVDQAQIDNANLQLAYCHITAPISGRLGLRLVDPGNIVHASDANGLVVITQLQPIAVVFSLPEDNLPQVLAKLKAGDRLQVDAYDRSQQRKLATGSLLTVDNQIDPSTGTVRLKAVFPNADNALFPNQFVNARLILDVKRGVAVVPTAAIQRSSQGAFVYVVTADQRAAMRSVTVGASQGDETSISSGLAPGELVVADGADKLRDGAKVRSESRASPPKAGA